MPVARFVCPYCEKEAEVQVTSVTRSRPCPHCNKGVMIQVAARDRKGKHRALLIATDSKAPLIREDATKPVPGPAYEPQPLEGEVFERMKQDPEVRAFRNRLIWGVLAVTGLIVLASLWSMFAPVSDTPLAQVVAPTIDASNRPIAPAEAQLVSSIPATSTPSSSNGVLLFQTSGKDKPSRSSTSSSASAVLSPVMKLLQAKNVEQVLDTVADRKELEPLIREYTALHGVQPVPYETLDLVPASQVPASCIASVAITLPDGRKRLANLLAEPDGPRVDWPSFVALSQMNWSAFTKQAPSSSLLFRVLMDDAERYDNAFADRQALRCVKLLNPNDPSSVPLYGYVERNSTIGEELGYLLRQSHERPLRMTLRLRFPADPSTPDQVWIEDIVTPGWVVPSETASSQATISSE